MNEDSFREMMYSIFQQQQNMLRYEIAEGFVQENSDGTLSNITPEMLDVDVDNIFNGLQDVVTEINSLYGC